MEVEIWKDIPGYEGLYQASNLGNIKSLNYNRKHIEKIMKPALTPRGYLRLELCKNKVRKGFFVHTLVAMTFIENLDNLPEVNHKDENKLNNCVENLEWCNGNYNLEYGTRISRIREKIAKPVNQYDLNGNFIKSWVSIFQVEKELNILNPGIVACCKGRRKTAGGYIWRYANE